MPKYYCDYCDTYLTHDSPSVRKTHCSGRKHKENVRLYYQKWLEEQVQKLVDDTTAAFKAGVAQQQKTPVPGPMPGPPAGAMPAAPMGGPMPAPMPLMGPGPPGPRPMMMPGMRPQMVPMGGMGMGPPMGMQFRGGPPMMGGPPRMMNR
ncbi:hypothetical protein ACF0H5_015670 [Mactra antiquata]